MDLDWLGGPQLSDDWYQLIAPIVAENRCKLEPLITVLRGDLKLPINQQLLPPLAQRLTAFALTSVDDVRVVIIGQDPYHGVGQAMGLSFSIPPDAAERGIKFPPSLRNILRELEDDFRETKAEPALPTLLVEPALPIGPTLSAVPAAARVLSGDLTSWAQQGVLLLNTALTVKPGVAGSCSELGWRIITEGIIRELSRQKEHVVFMLWGRHAQRLESLIDPQRHLVLKAAHPSPLSARSGFFGCRHFSRANNYLNTHNYPKIRWLE